MPTPRAQMNKPGLVVRLAAIQCLLLVGSTAFRLPRAAPGVAEVAESLTQESVGPAAPVLRPPPPIGGPPRVGAGIAEESLTQESIGPSAPVLRPPPSSAPSPWGAPNIPDPPSVGGPIGPGAGLIGGIGPAGAGPPPMGTATVEEAMSVESAGPGPAMPPPPPGPGGPMMPVVGPPMVPPGPPPPMMFKHKGGYGYPKFAPVGYRPYAILKGLLPPYLVGEHGEGGPFMSDMQPPPLKKQRRA